MLKTVISFLPFMVCLFWFVAFAARFRKNDGARRMLTAFLAVCAVLYFCHALYFTGNMIHGLNCIWSLCSLSAYPMYYLYIHILTNGSNPRHIPYWILLPGPIVAFCIYLFPGEATELARKAVFFLEVAAVCWIGTVRLRRFDDEIASIYTDTEGRSVSDVRRLLLAFVATSVLSAVANAIGKQFFAGSDSLLTGVAVVFATMLYIISFIGFSRSFTYDKMVEDIPEDDHEMHLQPHSDTDLGQKIEQVMTEQQLFLREGLKIGDLVQSVGSCRTYVSNYINNTKGMSFSDYVNSLRIEYAKKLILEEEGIKFISLSERLGFTNEQSFYRNFKKFSGLTPAQWKAQHCK